MKRLAGPDAAGPAGRVECRLQTFKMLDLEVVG
jgi:hypothetical protein